MNDIPVYKIEKTSIEDIFPNPLNPRMISEEKFKKLIESIQAAPWMLKLRPIVVNKDGVIIGGNQRYRACKEAGLSDVWVIHADSITDDQAKRFVLRDNIDFGRWDLEIIRKQYSLQELEAYGAEIELVDQNNPQVVDSVSAPPPIGDDDSVEPDISDEELEKHARDFNDSSIKQIVFQLPTEIYEEALKNLDYISKELDLDDNSEVLLHLIEFYEAAHGLGVE